MIFLGNNLLVVVPSTLVTLFKVYARRRYSVI
jgi:hypothetical protein